MKRDNKNTEFATDEPTKQSFASGADPKNLMGAKNIRKPHAHNVKKTLLWMRKKVSPLHYKIRQFSVLTILTTLLWVVF